MGKNRDFFPEPAAAGAAMTPARAPRRRKRGDFLIIEGSDPAAQLVFQHTALCQTVLPYRDPGPELYWRRRNGSVSMWIEAGRMEDPSTGNLVQLGLPFGAKPRLILAYLNAEALRTNSPAVEVEGSLSAFLERIGLHRHGRNIRTIKDQLARLSAATIRLAVKHDGRYKQVNSHVISEFDLWFPKDKRQRLLWPAHVVLSSDYFLSLKEHGVPLDENAVRHLAGSALALDLYAWLAQRLCRVGRTSVEISWIALKAQFGPQYDRLDNFRQEFRETLAQVLAHYPAARVEIGERGMTLRESDPPVKRLPPWKRNRG